MQNAIEEKQKLQHKIHDVKFKDERPASETDDETDEEWNDILRQIRSSISVSKSKLFTTVEDQRVEEDEDLYIRRNSEKRRCRLYDGTLSL